MIKNVFSIGLIILGLSGNGCRHASQQQKTGSDSMLSKPAREINNFVPEKVNTPAQIFAKPEIPVLCYHRIADDKQGDYAVSPAVFTSHMKVLADSGYHSISPEQLYNYLVYNRELPEKPVLISFDDSREEHALIAAPTMEKFGFKGVFFIMTITYNKKNYMTTDQIRQLAKSGHTIGLHSWDHTMVTKYADSADWQKEVAKPKEKLESITGSSIDFWAYPNGVFNHKAAMELEKFFKLSFSLATKRDSIVPLQTVRRIIVPSLTPQGLLHTMRKTFGRKN